jgi:hypothetical protein
LKVAGFIDFILHPSSFIFFFVGFCRGGSIPGYAGETLFERDEGAIGGIRAMSLMLLFARANGNILLM